MKIERLKFVISFSLICHLHVKIDQLSHHRLLAQYVGVIWSGSWKSRSLKVVILQDAHPDIQLL